MKQEKDKPKSFFKYQAINRVSLGNLASSAAYFSSPKDFNDPYDCNLAVKVKPSTDGDLIRFQQHLFENLPPNDPRIEVIRKFELSQLRDYLEPQLATSLENYRKERVMKLGVACFSETNSEMLMWSHYSQSGGGFCLGFDPAAEMFRKVRQVEYSPVFPELDAIRTVLDHDLEEFWKLYLTKSQHWVYEKEWRAFHIQNNTKFNYGPSDLKAVYFGSESTRSDQNVVAIIAQRLHPEVKFFRGKINPDEFKIDFEECSFSTERKR